MDHEMIDRLVPILMKHSPQTKIGAVIVIVELLTAMREPTLKIKAVKTMSISYSAEEIWQAMVDCITND